MKLPNQADVLNRMGALICEANEMEAKLRELGLSSAVPSRPQVEREDILLTAKELELHVSELAKLLASHGQPEGEQKVAVATKPETLTQRCWQARHSGFENESRQAKLSGLSARCAAEKESA